MAEHRIALVPATGGPIPPSKRGQEVEHGLSRQ